MKVFGLLKKILFILLFFAVLGYVIYAMTNMSSYDPEEKCTDVVLVVEDNPNAGFIDKKGVETLLKEKNLFPKGEKMVDIDTRTIEQTVAQNPFIENVECYKTPDCKLCLHVVQRTPVMFIMPDNAESYFVDVKGNIIPGGSYPVNMPVATGNISKEYAAKQLADFACFLRDNSFWNKQVEQVNVVVDRNNRNPSEHEMAVCELNGDYTLKYFRREGDEGWLIPANPDFKRIRVTADDRFAVWGVVRFVIHRA